MPTITRKKNLGSLFGGKVMSMTYNFQTGSEATTATITVLSSNQKYTMPEFNSTVMLPEVNIPMKVIEYTIHDGEYRYLQVELIELASDLLDKQLILLWGEHTDTNGSLNNDFYMVYQSVFYDYDPFVIKIKQVSGYKYPNYTSTSKDGINVIGFARGTMVEDGYIFMDARLKLIEVEPKILVIDKNSVSSLSNIPDASYFSGEPNRSVQFGYTLQELKDVIISLGGSIHNSHFFNDTSIMFTETGTLRQVLSSVLSKIGLSFYIDPLSQKIVIVSNNDIASMNRNLEARFGSFCEAGASQKSFTKSIRGVEATHYVAKGDYGFGSGGGSQGPGEREGSTKLFRVDDEYLLGRIPREERGLANKFAPLFLLGIDSESIEQYVDCWHSVDGNSAGNFYRFRRGIKVLKNKATWNDSSAGLNKEGKIWCAFIKENPSEVNRFMTTQEAIGLRSIINEPNQVSTNYSQNYKNKCKAEDEMVPSSLGTNASEYLAFLEAYSKLYGGLYISYPMNFRYWQKCTFADIDSVSGGEIELFSAEASTKIIDIPQLSFIVKLITMSGKSMPDLTVEDLANHANVNIERSPLGTVTKGIYSQRNNGGTVGSRWYQMAIRKLPLGSYAGEFLSNIGTQFSQYIDSICHQTSIDLSKVELEAEELKELEQNNFIVFTNQTSTKVNKLARDVESMIEDIRKCKYEKTIRGEKIFQSAKSLINYIILHYKYPSQFGGKEGTGVDSSESESGEGKMINNIPCNLPFFEKRSLQVFSGSRAEVKNFITNFGTFNPPTPSIMISSSVTYERPPQREDFALESGLSTLSAQVTTDGISTTINYASRNFAPLDQGIVKETIGNGSAIIRLSPQTPPAWTQK